MNNLFQLKKIITFCGALACLSAFACVKAARAETATSPVTSENSPLVLAKRGSFFIGGEKAKQNFIELGSQRAADTVTINQMYVEFMQPVGKTKLPVVMVHGAGLSGNSYDTTPDGRMGWYEYFVRNAYPTYVVDQVGRARSGFNQAIFNGVGAKEADPSQQPKITRMGDLHAAWINFRIGPSQGVAYKDSQFPIEAIDELSRMGIPDLSASLTSPNPNYQTLSMLADKLDGIILMGHSQSGHFPLETALLNSEKVKAMILLEPGTCLNDQLSDAQLKKLTSIPLLVVYGDHLSSSTELPGNALGWQQRFEGCQTLIKRINTLGGHAQMLYPPSLGILGNSHMLMLDKNNLQIADLIMDWINKNTNQ
ncbi:hypothetical protein DM558_02700 [Entomomonas moraniae]|uniref:Esterase n=1 Tax=Entomomonas moraniae TaxID=2213226 RepID=A0A3Q9JKP9_9GAMM|nr:hypothetical protein [Entomomonas moraniae]AZS49756.1 hypothetical protein DM558_02700 [Entomomonas moraniae]